MSYRYKGEKLALRGEIKAPQYYSPAVNRPNKLAAGMSYTHSRQFGRERAIQNNSGKGIRPTNTDILALLVYGSNDVLRPMTFIKERAACPCCGSKQGGKYQLNDRGRTKLRAMRRKRQKRGAES